MTDTIRPKIDAIAPALTGVDERTLSDVYDGLAALRGGGPSDTLSDLGVDIRAIAPALTGVDERTLSDVYDGLAALRGGGMSDTLSDLGVDIRAIAPSITGVDERTLSDVYDGLAALRGGGMSDTLSDLGVDIRAIGGTEQKTLSDIWERLDAIAAALGAAPYGDLELGSVRGFLSNIQTTSGKISRAIGDTEPSEPYLAVRPYLAQIAQKASDSAASLAELETLGGTSNSLLGDINVSLGDGSDLISAIDTLIGEQGTQGDLTRQTVLDTSGSIRLDLVAVKDAVAGGASAVVGEIIAARDQTLDALDAQTASIEAAIGASTSTLSGAIGAQTAAIDALFEEYVGTAYADGDTEPTSLNDWLARLDIKLSFVAAEFGWGT